MSLVDSTVLLFLASRLIADKLVLIDFVRLWAFEENANLDTVGTAGSLSICGGVTGMTLFSGGIAVKGMGLSRFCDASFCSILRS
jgi:hypothetical protein